MAITTSSNIEEVTAGSKYKVTLGRHDEGVVLLIAYAKGTDSQLTLKFSLDDETNPTTDGSVIYQVITGASPVVADSMVIDTDGNWAIPVAVPMSMDTLYILLSDYTDATVDIRAVGSEGID